MKKSEGRRNGQTAMFVEGVPRGCSQQAGLHDNLVLPRPTGNDAARGGAVGPPTGNRGNRKPAGWREPKETHWAEQGERVGGGSMVDWQKMRKKDAIPCWIYLRSYAPYRDAG